MLGSEQTLQGGRPPQERFLPHYTDFEVLRKPGPCFAEIWCLEPPTSIVHSLIFQSHHWRLMVPLSIPSASLPHGALQLAEASTVRPFPKHRSSPEVTSASVERVPPEPWALTPCPHCFSFPQIPFVIDVSQLWWAVFPLAELWPYLSRP